MANAPAIFSASAITELIRLEGRAKITFPTADASHFRVERSAKLSKVKYAALAFNQPDSEFSSALLKSYQKVSEDAQWVQVVLRYETLPGLALTTITNSYIDLIPAEFKAAEQYTTITTRIDPSTPTTPDATSETVLSSSVQMETAVEGTKTNVTRPAGTWPVLTGYEVNGQTLGEKAAVIRTIGSSSTPDQGFFVITSTVTPLGNGDFLRNTTEFQNPPAWPVLTAKTLGAVNAIPQEFRLSIELDEVRTMVAAGSTPDPLAGLVVESSVEPIDKYRSEKRTTSLSTGTFPTLTGYELNAKGQSVAITKSIVAAGHTPTLTFTSEEGTTVQPLNVNLSLENDRSIPTISTDTFKSFRQTGGNAGSLLEETQRTFLDITSSNAPTGFPDTGANVLSDEIVDDTLQRSVRIIRKLTDEAGADPTLPVYSEPLEYDKETKTQLYRDYKLVQATAPIPALGSAWTGAVAGTVIDARIVGIGEAPYFSRNAILEVEYCALPQPWVEFPMVGYEFPALFKFADHYFVDSITAYYSGFPPPWPGDGTTVGTFQLIAHRSAVRQARRTHTYSIGPSNSYPAAFKVITPGVSSRFFQIPPNCIHAAINISGTFAGVSYPIETIPASSPSGYSTRQILVQGCEERRVFGNIYEKILTEISEDTSPDQFGPIYGSVGFQATGQPGIIQQPDAAGETLWISSDNAGDITQDVRVYGRQGANVIRELVALNGLAMIPTVNKYQALYHVHLRATCAGNVTCYGSGIPKAGVLDFGLATIVSNDTVTVGRTGSTQTYRFRSVADTLAVANDVQMGSTNAISIRNLALAINGTGIPGTTAAGANYFTATVPTANIAATVDATDRTVVHVADSAALQANSNTYSLSASSTGVVVVAFAGDSNGPALTAAIPPGKADAYKNPLFLSNPDLLFNPEGTAVGLAVAPGAIFEFAQVVSASTDGSNTISHNLPATVNLTSDWTPVPPSASGYSLIMCLAGTPSLPMAYDTWDGVHTAVAGVTPLPAIGNGKVFNVRIAESAPAFIRVRIDNSAPPYVARAVHVALSYQVPT
jgi:hypothetical protein